MMVLSGKDKLRRHMRNIHNNEQPSKWTAWQNCVLDQNIHLNKSMVFCRTNAKIYLCSYIWILDVAIHTKVADSEYFWEREVSWLHLCTVGLLSFIHRDSKENSNFIRSTSPSKSSSTSRPPRWLSPSPQFSPSPMMIHHPSFDIELPSLLASSFMLFNIWAAQVTDCSDMNLTIGWI